MIVSGWCIGCTRHPKIPLLQETEVCQLQLVRQPAGANCQTVGQLPVSGAAGAGGVLSRLSPARGRAAGGLLAPVATLSRRAAWQLWPPTTRPARAGDISSDVLLTRERSAGPRAPPATPLTTQGGSRDDRRQRAAATSSQRRRHELSAAPPRAFIRAATSFQPRRLHLSATRSGRR